jgi:uncharacterized protein (DUF608 family)
MKSPSPLFPFEHSHLLQTAMPLGGIGAGNVCLNGYGGLQDFSIHNRPATSALPDKFYGEEVAFAVLHIKGEKPVTRLIEGQIPVEKIYDQGLKSQGFRNDGAEGFPRFRRTRFRSGYPFGSIELSDPKVPLLVQLIGWSPLIPRDDVNSGIPCAILEYTFRNTSRKRVEFEFSYHASHFAPGAAANWGGTRNQVIPGKGVFFSNTESLDSETLGSSSFTIIGHRPVIKAMWLRGGWFDAISALWREVDGGKFIANDGQAEIGRAGRNGGSVLVKGSLAPGKEMTIPVVLTWHFPNSNQSYACAPATDGEGVTPKWRTFYSSQWRDARDVAEYVQRHHASLRERTVAFQNALLGSTLPEEVRDAVSANLAILKSPTIMRQASGNLWGWEGCFTDRGSCEGSCTHVWNYAQSISHLFPNIERTLRETEYKRSMDEKGHISFRSALPDGPARHDHHPAADGQLGGIMKLYRDWHICGDTEWLKELYSLAKRSLDYCIERWDPDHKGALFEPHHNTYDIEFWGADGMCTTIYIGALSAMSEMARALGHEADGKAYADLAARGSTYIDKELFNGEYYLQRVQFKGLRDTSHLDLVSGKKKSTQSQGLLELMKKEGPRYQYGTGCLSDGVIGAWMASIYGIATPLDLKKIRKNLRAIYRHNFRRSLVEHANPQRCGYAVGDEPGLLLCTWPQGGKPVLPFPYSDEVWTGIEYQVASHLIAEGLVKEGLEIVKALRGRYTGPTRNPWNEYECGSYYARAMASYALLATLSGFRYSAVEKTLWFGPKLDQRPFSVFFSTASAHGTIALTKTRLTIDVLEGQLAIDRIELNLGGSLSKIAAKAVVKAGKPVSIRIPSLATGAKNKSVSHMGVPANS